MSEPVSAPVAVLELRKAAASLREAGQAAEAVAQLRQAAKASPGDADVQAELGLTLHMMGRTDEAESHYQRALELDPNDVFALSNLGAVYLQTKRLAEAEQCFRAALALKPEHPQALRNLGVILKDAANLVEAKACFRKATETSGSLEVSIQAAIGLSPVVASMADLAEQRRSYVEGLDAFAQSPRIFAYDGERNNLPWFYLAYHAEDNRALMERTAEVVAKKVDSGPAPSLSVWRPPSEDGRRIRVAFCSEFFSAHTIGRLYRGIIHHLDRRAFEVTVLHGSHSVGDAFRAELDSYADRAIALPRRPDAQREVITRLNPDILFFPDIGMSAQTYFLASTRLAPIQAASWGHPGTTGLRSIDYFVSADGAEPDGAETAYGERLVRLERLPALYESPAAAPAVSRSALRLPEGGMLYGCPQSPFKLHPEFDAILAEIVERDPAARLVFVEGASPALADVLRRRWALTHPTILEHATFLPRVSHEGFMALMAHIDVLLDPIHFGSGNTLYEAMAFGTPIVTWPGRFMRGRIVAAAYAQMGVERAPIADSPKAYAAMAVELGSNPSFRAALRAELRSKAREQLFEDLGAVRALEQFFTAAVAAHAAGGHLAPGWRNVALEATV